MIHASQSQGLLEIAPSGSYKDRVWSSFLQPCVGRLSYIWDFLWCKPRISFVSSNGFWQHHRWNVAFVVYQKTLIYRLLSVFCLFVCFFKAINFICWNDGGSAQRFIMIYTNSVNEYSLMYLYHVISVTHWSSILMDYFRMNNYSSIIIYKATIDIVFLNLFVLEIKFFLQNAFQFIYSWILVLFKDVQHNLTGVLRALLTIFIVNLEHNGNFSYLNS